MSETKWTPGMWKVAGPDLPKCVVAAATPNENILVINETEGLAEFPTPESAALFAAAPDMAAALAEAAETIEWLAPAKGDCKCSGAFECVAHSGLAIVRSALARARGETP